ncbi:MAG: hypothetical protein Q7R31_04620 [Candidatus Levybacteria bacterium]|nr:hypothetical protein [Candidatus Levybacteria bacterium]
MDLNFINSLHPGLWIKIITLVAIVFYVVFTFVVFTQVKVMGEILVLPNSKAILKIISIIHIALAISLFLVALVIL